MHCIKLHPTTTRNDTGVMLSLIVMKITELRVTLSLAGRCKAGRLHNKRRIALCSEHVLRHYLDAADQSEHWCKGVVHSYPHS